MPGSSDVRPSTCAKTCERNLIFVLGKGGVGKTSLSQALALALSEKAKVLWACFEDPSQPLGETRQVLNASGMTDRLWHLNAESMKAFEEYASLKIDKLGSFFGAFGTSHLTKIFLQNKLIRYLAKAAPGIHELVLLGKVWHERAQYDHVVVDMPSTGYGVAMFQSAANFSRLFGGGPLARDAEEMLATFRDPRQTGHVIVALPEEMPLREALELSELLKEMFPDNLPQFVANRIFPRPRHPEAVAKRLGSPETWINPLAQSIPDYALRRSTLEFHNLKLWSDRGMPFTKIDFVRPAKKSLEAELALQLRAKGVIS